MTEQKPTEEEIKEQRIGVARKTLEDKVLQSVVGSNNILKDPSLYGNLASNGAENTYNKSMNTENAQKIKQGLYERAKEKGDRFGAYGKPSITDYDISVEILGQIEENKSRLPLKELGEIVKSIAGNYNYDFNVPKELSDYVPLELQEKIQKAAIEATKEGKEIDTREINNILSEKESDALQVYQLLSQAYNRAVSLGTCNYFADMNELGNQITEKYKPKEDKE